MIKFFRKIRQQLLEENRFSKYLLYAIGEIVLVVVGILIALQLDNWNENSKNATKEKEYLYGLQEDLGKQLSLFDDRAVFYDQLIETGESVLTDYTQTEKLFQIDSINKKLSFLLYTNSYPEVNRTFNELNTTGHINLIREKNLKSDIITYYLNSESTARKINGNVENVNYNQIFPILKSAIIVNLENFGFPSDNTDQQGLTKKMASTLENSLDDPNKEFEIINAISMRIILLKSNELRIQKIKDEAEELLSTINAKL